MARRAIPDIVVGRLPVYLRALSFLIAEGRQITSSQELGDRLGISSAQIRKDLSHFGEFGKQGTGYDINFLYDQLRQILKVNQKWDVALVGAGNLGKAIADYGGFKGKGFVIKAIFDKVGLEAQAAINADMIRLYHENYDTMAKVGMTVYPLPGAERDKWAEKLKPYADELLAGVDQATADQVRQVTQQLDEKFPYMD